MVPGTCQVGARRCSGRCQARAWHQSRPKKTGARSLDAASQLSTSARSSGVVTFSSRGSPGDDRDAPSARFDERGTVARSRDVALERRPEHVGRERLRRLDGDEGRARGSVSTTRSPSTRLIVSATGRPGTAPSHPSTSAASTRSITSSGTSGRAASWTTMAAASRSASATPNRTDSARVAPPVTVAETLPQPSSSATRIDGSSQPSGATTTIASIQSEASSRSRLSASSGRPRSGAKALGRSPPSRSPRPAATRTAQVLKSRRR